MDPIDSNILMTNVQDQKLNTHQLDDLLEPQYYPDPGLLRDSLMKITKEDIELKKNLMSTKATLRVLAPFLKIIHKDQKRIIESASGPRNPKSNERFVFHKKSNDQLLNAHPDISERTQMFVSINETADVLKTLVRATAVVTYLVNPVSNEIYQNPKADSLRTVSWNIEKGSTMAAYTAYTKQYSISNSVLKDSRFPMGLGYEEPSIKYAMCVPIKTPDDKVVAVYELTRGPFDEAFDKRDLQSVLAVTGWMGVAILQNTLHHSLAKQHELNDYLLQLTNHYHSGVAPVDNALTDIIIFARETVGAERCNLYLVDKEAKGTLVVDEYEQGMGNPRQLFRSRTKKHIVDDGSVLCKIMLNKKKVNERFETQQDEPDGHNNQVRSILGVPIISNNIVLGAILLTNKRLLESFEREDEDILHTFASYCTINITHLKLHDKVKKVELQNTVTQEMLFYHIQPCIHDQEAIKKPFSKDLPDQFFTFSWYPAPDDMPKLAELTINMFHEVLGDTFMALNNVPKFVLTVRNCYRPNPYHNYLHAFGVTHTMANIISRYHRIFTGMERKALMVACLCHDVDHRAYTNNFVQLTKHYLASLYVTSPLENHHFAVAKMIIEQCGMFKYIKPEIYNELLTEIYESIIATDLSLYFQNRMELMRIADEKTFTFKNVNHRRLVKSVMITASDLSGQTKSFPVCKKITEDCYEEFYHQGDIEKKIGFPPLPTMDREKKGMIAENQVQFLSAVVLPCVEIVSRFFSTVTPMVWDSKALLKQWKELVQGHDEQTSKPDDSVTG